MIFRFAAMAFIAAFPFVSPAGAADYSQDGVFVLAPETPSMGSDDPAKLQLKCALNFYINSKNGSFEQYFLDRDKFLKDGTVSYLEARAGSCKLDDATKLESCQSKYAANGQISDEDPTFNFYKEMSPQKLSAYYFSSADDFAKWKAAGSAPIQLSWTQVKCSDLTSDVVTKHISQDINPLSEDETGKRLFNDAGPADDDYATAQKVIDALKK